MVSLYKKDTAIAASTEKVLEETKKAIVKFREDLKELEEMNNTKKILSFIASRNEEWTSNDLITSDQKVFLKLVSDGLIEPNGKKSRLTQHGRDLLKELEKIKDE